MRLFVIVESAVVHMQQHGGTNYFLSSGSYFVLRLPRHHPFGSRNQSLCEIPRAPEAESHTDVT